MKILEQNTTHLRFKYSQRFCFRSYNIWQSIALVVCLWILLISVTYFFELPTFLSKDFLLQENLKKMECDRISNTQINCDLIYSKLFQSKYTKNISLKGADIKIVSSDIYYSYLITDKGKVTINSSYFDTTNEVNTINDFVKNKNLDFFEILFWDNYIINGVQLFIYFWISIILLLRWSIILMFVFIVFIWHEFYLTLDKEKQYLIQQRKSILGYKLYSRKWKNSDIKSINVNQLKTAKILGFSCTYYKICLLLQSGKKVIISGWKSLEDDDQNIINQLAQNLKKFALID